MADTPKLHRCTLCRRLREAPDGEPCAAKGDACGFATGAVEDIDVTPGAIKAMWRQNNAGSVRTMTWAIVGISVVLLAVAAMRMTGG